MTIGATSNTGGTLQIGNGGTTGGTGSGNIVDNGTIVFDTSSTYAAANNISGTGGGLIMGRQRHSSGTNTFIGPVNITPAPLSPAPPVPSVIRQIPSPSKPARYISTTAVTQPQAIILNGNSSVASLHGGGSIVSTFSGPVSLVATSAISVDGGATLQLTNPTAALSLNGNILYALTAGTLAIGGNTLPGAGAVALNYQGIIVSNIPIGLIPAAGTTIDIATPISDDTANASLVQNGLGTTQLTVDNYYSGVTTINNGMLEPMTANAIPYTTAGYLASGQSSTNPANTIAIGGSNSATGTANGRSVSPAALPSTTSSPSAVDRARLSPVRKSKMLRAATRLPAI